VARSLLPYTVVGTIFWVAALVVGLGGESLPGTTAGIEGLLRYPSCTDIPQDLQVCGEDVTSGTKVCTTPFSSPEGFRYRLDVPTGTYRVYASAPSIRQGYRAYYTESVRCGLSTKCIDHTPVLIPAIAGRTRAGVEPADWFGPAVKRTFSTFASNP
jgi:hypothetical protein